MSNERKFGDIHARAMLQLGLVELRNAFSFEGSNVQDDVRRSMYDARQNVNEQDRLRPEPEQQLQQDIQQER